MNQANPAAQSIHQHRFCGRSRQTTNPAAMINKPGMRTAARNVRERPFPRCSTPVSHATVTAAGTNSHGHNEDQRAFHPVAMTHRRLVTTECLEGQPYPRSRVDSDDSVVTPFYCHFDSVTVAWEGVS